MAPIHLMLLLLAIFQYTSADCITDGTELRFAFIVNRHGDRSPEEETLKTVEDSVNMEVADKKDAIYGYGQLTERGKSRAYELGKFLRYRYDGFLSETYNPSEIYVRPANDTRCKETLKRQMAGLYPSQSAVSNNTVIRQPVPDAVINNTYFTLEFYKTCEPFLKYLKKAEESQHSSIASQYPDLLRKLTSLTNINATIQPLTIFEMYDSYISLQNVGYKLKPEIKVLLPEMKKAAADTLEILMGQHDLMSLEAGVLLNDFFIAATEVCDKTSSQKMRLYSAHDLNVYTMEMVTQVTLQGVPNYCSLLALELRRVVKTGKLVVLVVYLPTPGDPVVYLRVRGCGGYLCDLDTFKGITQGYSITQQEFDSRCQTNSS